MCLYHERVSTWEFLQSILAFFLSTKIPGALEGGIDIEKVIEMMGWNYIAA